MFFLLILNAFYLILKIDQSFHKRNRFCAVNYLFIFAPIVKDSVSKFIKIVHFDWFKFVKVISKRKHGFRFFFVSRSRPQITGQSIDLKDLEQ